MSDARLTVEELKNLRRESPERLFGHLMEVRQAFLFGVEDHREEPERWGGEFRVSVNRNLNVHFARGFTADMPDHDSLPQFVVMADEERAGTSQDTSTTLDDGDSFAGVIYYLDPDDFEIYAEELSEVCAEYPDFDLVPDTYFLDREVLGYLRDVVLKHATVVAEREYDFRQGVVGGREAPPLPVVAREDSDDDDDEPVSNPDFDVIDGEHLRTLRFRVD
ncbi:MAG: hypothetical protein KDD82_13265 [Planctomycetes bacterium]|nr:hypothetical protein [Planctomycetota bacterium]